MERVCSDPSFSAPDASLLPERVGWHSWTPAALPADLLLEALILIFCTFLLVRSLEETRAFY